MTERWPNAKLGDPNSKPKARFNQLLRMNMFKFKISQVKNEKFD